MTRSIYLCSDPCFCRCQVNVEASICAQKGPW